MQQPRRLVPLLASVAVLAALPAEDVADRLSTIASQAADEIDGLTTLVLVGEQELLAEGFGSADPSSAQGSAGPDSSYRIGGLVPALITLDVLRRVERGELDLDDSVAELLEVPTDDAAPVGRLDERVALRHLLGHTSGFPAAEVFLAAEEATTASRGAFLRWLASEALETEPGECQRFDATNVLLAGWILADLTGEDVSLGLATDLFEPLDLADTEYRSDGPPRGELWEAHVEAGAELIECGFALEAFAARDLCSTARDLAHLMRAVVDREVLAGDGFEHWTEPVRLSDGSRGVTGFGAYPTVVGDHEGIAVGGGIADARVHVAWYPSFDLTIVVLGLGRHAPVDRLERRLARAVFEVPEPGPQDLPVAPDERALYVGGYYVACTRIAIEEQGEQLVAAWPSGRTIELAYQGFHRFLDRSDPGVRLTFEVEDDRAIAFTLEEHGTVTSAKRID